MIAGQMAENTTLTGSDVDLVTFVKYKFDYAFFKDEDPRAMELPLTGSMFTLSVASVGYVFLVCFILPRLMVGRPPMKLKNVVTVYNAFQVITNAFIITMCIKGGWFTSYSFICQPVDYSRSPQAMMMVQAFWWFYISKLIDWLDTVFFALRKKYDQITVLHVGHHFGMPFCMLYALKFFGGGHTSFLCLLNSFVHVLMYSYYLLAGLGYHKYLWWKKYLTTVQMVQFALLAVHQGQLLFIECDYPLFPQLWTLIWSPITFIFFLNFYLQSYKKSPTKVMPSLNSYVDKYTCFPVGAVQQKDNYCDDGTDDNMNDVSKFHNNLDTNK